MNNFAKLSEIDSASDINFKDFSWISYMIGTLGRGGQGRLIGFPTQDERDDYYDPADDYGNIHLNWNSCMSKISWQDAYHYAKKGYPIFLACGGTK